MKFKLIATMCLTSLIVLAVIGLGMRSAARKNTELAGLTTASTLANQVVALRRFYTANVVAPARDAGMRVDYDFADHAQTIPLPATLVKALGEEISQSHPGSVIRLYSRYPFPHRKATETYDTFELAALDALEKNPDVPFYKLESTSGRATMRYAVADLMSESCVNCHNSHPESPKTDWQINDVRGVIEVCVPVDEAQNQVYASGLRQTLIIVAGFCTILLITGLVLQSASRKVSRGVGTIGSSLAEISTVVEQQKSIASRAVAASHQTNVTVEHLQTSFTDNASTAERVTAQAREALEQAREGLQAAAQTLTSLSSLKGEVASVTEKIELLRDQVAQIGEIAKLVRGFSAETNVLALNAAVEAARAGRQGEGFGVIAVEIRKLADQSRQSVETINNLVSQIYEASDLASTATSRSQAEVSGGLRMMAEVESSLSQLSEIFERVLENVEQVSNNLRQQVSSVREVRQAMQSVDDGAAETAAGIARTKQGIDKVNRTTDELKKMI